jgi:hypothetical protein
VHVAPADTDDQATSAQVKRKVKQTSKQASKAQVPTSKVKGRIDE